MPRPLAAIPEIAYRPSAPKSYNPKIGVIGCGGITVEHLQAYRQANFNVVALCDLCIERAQDRARNFFPNASVGNDYQRVLQDASIEVVDITTHPEERVPIIEAALRAGKHVLSQKPFVLDLDEGQRLVDLAASCQRYLAVNQNGRWAPHFSYARQLVNQGALGKIFAAHLGCHWDHRWVDGTAFAKVKHLILLDYAIHWFDIVRTFFPGRAARRVYASTARLPEQTLMPSLLAQAAVEFDQGQSTLVFDAGVAFGQFDQTMLAGTRGTLVSRGPSIQEQVLKVDSELGSWSPTLTGKWFPDGFQGTMSELLCAIEAGRECSVSARDNLESLALCFAAVASADRGEPVVPGSVRRPSS